MPRVTYEGRTCISTANSLVKKKKGKERETGGQRRIIKEANPSKQETGHRPSRRRGPRALKFLLDGGVNSPASDSNTKVASRRCTGSRTIVRSPHCMPTNFTFPQVTRREARGKKLVKRNYRDFYLRNERKKHSGETKRMREGGEGKRKNVRFSLESRLDTRVSDLKTL